MSRLHNAHVMFVYHEFTYGGASKSLAFWIKVLTQAGAQVSVVTYRSNRPPRYDIPKNVRVIGPRFRIGLPVVKRLCDLITVLLAVRQVRPEVVIGMMPVNALYAFIAARAFGAKVIVSERGSPSAEKGWFAALKHYAMNRSDGGVFQTEGAKAFYGEKLRRKSIIMPNPAETKARPVDFLERKGEFVFLGRCEMRQKRHDLALKALAIAVRSAPHIKINFYGDGPDYEIVKSLAKEMGLSTNVNFWGAVDGVPNLMETYKYFLLSSDYEGIPNALIEAMLAGMACVSTDCEPGGARLLIEHEKNGLLVKRGDPQALADSMLRLVHDDELARGLGRQAREIAKTLDPAIVGEKLIDFVGHYIATSK